MKPPQFVSVFTKAFRIERIFDVISFGNFAHMLDDDRGNVLRQAAGRLANIFDRLMRKGSDRKWTFELACHQMQLEKEAVDPELVELCMER